MWRHKLTALQKEETVMNKKLYLDCTSGISGDMFVAAMIDLGADLEALERALQSVSDDGFHTEVRRVKKSTAMTTVIVTEKNTITAIVMKKEMTTAIVMKRNTTTDMTTDTATEGLRKSEKSLLPVT